MDTDMLYILPLVKFPAVGVEFGEDYITIYYKLKLKEN